MISFLLNFWRTLGSHAPFLMMALPVIGAALATAAAFLSADLARRTALTNVILSCVAAVAMLVHFRAPQAATGPPQMLSTLSWATLTDDVRSNTRVEWRWTTGVDGGALPFLAVLPFVVLVSLLSLPADDPAIRFQIPWLLVWQSTLVGVLAAQDVALWSMCLLLAGIPPVVLVGGGGGPQRRERARTLGLQWGAAALCTVAGTLGAVASLSWMLQVSPRLAESMPTTFDLPTLVRSLPLLTTSLDAARLAWKSDAAWIVPLSITGGALFLPLPPWRANRLEVLAEARPPVRLALSTAYLIVGTSVLLRVVGPLSREGLAMTDAPFWIGVAAVAAALDRPSVRKGAAPASDTTARFVAVQACVAAAGIVSNSPSAQAGGVVLAVNTILAITASAAAERRGAGWTSTLPALSGLPPFGGFAGGWLILAGLLATEENVLAAATSAVALTLTTVSTIRTTISAWRADSGPNAAFDGLPADRTKSHMSIVQMLLLGACGGASLALGVVPQAVASRVMQSLLPGLK